MKVKLIKDLYEAILAKTQEYEWKATALNTRFVIIYSIKYKTFRYL